MMSSTSSQLPMVARICAFNREPKTGRCKYTVVVQFEDQEWRISRYYTDFLNLQRNLLSSQYDEVAGGLPPKHPFGMVVSRMFSSQQSWMRAETPFIKERMNALGSWLADILSLVGPDGVDEVDFLDVFFEAFSPGGNEALGQADVDRSLLHVLKKFRVSTSVYKQAWAEGYTYNTLHTIPREKWSKWGVPDGSIEGLEVQFGGLRHDRFSTVMGADGRVNTVRIDAVTGEVKAADSVGLQGSFSASRAGSSSSFQTTANLQGQASLPSGQVMQPGNMMQRQVRFAKQGSVGQPILEQSQVVQPVQGLPAYPNDQY